MEIKISVTGLDVAITSIQNIMTNIVFPAECSADFKSGFFMRGNAIIKALENIQKEGAEDGRTPNVCEDHHRQ